MKAIHLANRMRFSIVALTACVLISIGITPHHASAADVTLAWDPNQESDLEGYGVFYKKGSNGPPYDLGGYVSVGELSDADAPTFTITGLQQDATYYFAVTAYDTSGNESAFSASVCAQVGAVVTPCAASSDGSVPSSSANAGSSSDSGGGGGGGGGCFIQSLSAGDNWGACGLAGLLLGSLAGFGTVARRRWTLRH
jgi:hypothetical protein